MRIERSQPIQQANTSFFSKPLESHALDTIRYGKTRSTACNLLLFVQRKVSNFIRRILSYFFPVVKPKAPVQIEEITFQKSTVEGAVVYRLFLYGVETQNQVKLRKVDDTLQLVAASFPDEEMIQHFGSILEYILKREKVNHIEIKYLSQAKLLWDAGLTTEDKIHYSPAMPDWTNNCIKTIISCATMAERRLPNDAAQALIRIQSALEPGMVDSLLRSMVNVGRDLSGDISVTDLLILLEATKMRNKSGIVLNTVGDVSYIRFTPSQKKQ